MLPIHTRGTYSSRLPRLGQKQTNRRCTDGLTWQQWLNSSQIRSHLELAVCKIQQSCWESAVEGFHRSHGAHEILGPSRFHLTILSMRVESDPPDCLTACHPSSWQKRVRMCSYERISCRSRPNESYRHIIMHAACTNSIETRFRATSSLATGCGKDTRARWWAGSVYRSSPFAPMDRFR